MSNELTNVERETHISMTADDRSTWEVYSDDPVMMRRLDAIGEVIATLHGGGKRYRLRADQITLRKGKRVLSEVHKAQLAARMRALRQNHSVTVA